jgi:hypothetical protein
MRRATAKYLYAIALLLTVWASAVVRAQEATEPIVRTAELGPVRLALRIERTRLRIDDPLIIDLSAEAPLGTTVQLPELANDPGQLRVASQEKMAPQTIGDDRQIWQQRSVLHLENVGEVDLPTLSLRYRLPAAESDQYLSIEPVGILVTSVLPSGADQQTVRDISAPLALAEPRWPIIGLIVGAGTLSAVAVGAALWHRRKRRSEGGVERASCLDLLGELDRLLASARSRTDMVDLHTRLADLLRQHVSTTYGMDAARRTTEEVLLALRSRASPTADAYGQLGSVLSACDLVKFARHQPPPATAQETLTLARAFLTGSSAAVPA